jgi:DNA-directed RNA polymerase specialized sigma24 family protein
MNFNNNKALSTYNNVTRGIEIRQQVLERRVREHEGLLYKIAASLGYLDNDMPDLVNEVCSYATRHYGDKEGELSLRVWLAKMMVYKCIYGISCKLFSQGFALPEKPAFNSNYSCYSISHAPALLNMPLGFRAVYILHHIGFDEVEIATILNTDVIAIKKRFNQALLFINMPPG